MFTANCSIDNCNINMNEKHCDQCNVRSHVIRASIIANKEVHNRTLAICSVKNHTHATFRPVLKYQPNKPMLRNLLL